MPGVACEPSNETEAAELVAKTLGMGPVAIARQPLGASGNAVYRADLPDGNSVTVRCSPAPRAFAYTRRNLKALRILGLPVQSVLASGRTVRGGSFVILNWMPGRDLVHELGEMSHAQMTRLAEQVVDYQRRLVLLPKSDGFGWAPIGQNGPLQRWTDVFGGKLCPADADDGTALGQWRARLCRLRSRLEPYFSHLRPTPFLDDLTTKNILVENRALSGIIDVDFICYGDPLLAIGATMASIAADVPEVGAFYGEELIRLWNLSATQRQAVWFYAALWAVGALTLIDLDSARIDKLGRAAQSWLGRAEQQPTITRNRSSRFDRKLQLVSA